MKQAPEAVAWHLKTVLHELNFAVACPVLAMAAAEVSVKRILQAVAIEVAPPVHLRMASAHCWQL